MKNVSFVTLFSLIILVSCSKTSPEISSSISQSIAESPENIAPNGPTPPGYGGSSAVGLGVYQSGNHYQTSFAGGLTFSSFPYPLNVPTTGGVVLFNPAYGGLGSTNNMLSVNQNGPYISITVSALGTTLAMDTRAKLNTYYKDLSDFFTNAKDPTTGSLKQPFLPTIPIEANSNGYITYSGTFIIDPNIPVTHVSIATGFIKQTAAANVE